MEFSQLIDIVFKIDGTINFLWNLYLGVCVVLLGWVFGAKVKWPLVKRITVSVAFILAGLMNVTAQLDNYRLKAIVLEELRQKPEFNKSAFIQAFAKNTGVGEAGVVFIHLAMGLVIVGMIWIYTGKKAKGQLNGRNSPVSSPQIIKTPQRFRQKLAE